MEFQKQFLCRRMKHCSSIILYSEPHNYTTIQAVRVLKGLVNLFQSEAWTNFHIVARKHDLYTPDPRKNTKQATLLSYNSPAHISVKLSSGPTSGFNYRHLSGSIAFRQVHSGNRYA